MSVTRRCHSCKQHKSLSGGAMIGTSKGKATLFICADCKLQPSERNDWDRDSYWLYKRLGREPTEDEEEIFCERVAILWSQGYEDEEARLEAYRRQFE